MAAFDSPTGKFSGLVHVDDYSLKISGGAFTIASPTGEGFFESLSSFLTNFMTICLWTLKDV
jgi:hypothetical protein